MTKSPVKGDFKKDKNLIFDSNFESGNLEVVEVIDNNEYDLQMTVDTNTRGHS